MHTNSIKRLIKYLKKMKKFYVTPEMDEFKFEMPQLFGDGEAETGSEGIGGSGAEGDDAA